MLLLGGCLSTRSEVAACPPLKSYSAAQQDRAVTELRALPAGSELGAMVADYGVLRDQVRACAGAKVGGS
jgi:hypothetical protein